MRLSQDDYDNAVFACCGYVDVEEDKEDNACYCPVCAGSGEGRSDNSTCPSCQGLGTVKWLN